MISTTTTNSTTTGYSVLSYLTAQNTGSADSASSASDNASVKAKAAAAATSAAALQSAGATQQAAVAGKALDKQQATLAGDLRAAMAKAGVKLTGAVEFSVSADSKVTTQGGDADKAAVTAFLKSDTTRPGFASRIATQAQDALNVSSKIQQHAAVSQAARYGGRGAGVVSLYTSLMQQPNKSAAVFTLAPAGSALSYPGSLAAKA